MDFGLVKILKLAVDQYFLYPALYLCIREGGSQTYFGSTYINNYYYQNVLLGTYT